MFRSSLQLEAATVLDWPKLLESLAVHAHSSQGKQRCMTLDVKTDLDEVSLLQQETTEMVALRELTDPFPSVGFPDISEILARVVKGAWLEAPELRDCSLMLGTIETVAEYVRRHPEAVRVGALTKPLEDQSQIRRLRRSLDAAILPDGSIAESATPELRRLTHHAQELKQRIRHQLDHILHSKRYAEVLQETYFDQRQGRYVVPVKAEMQGRIPGILHDVSASGATVFLEPRELVDLNNAIKVADLEIDREVRRILRELSALVAERADDLRRMIDVLVELDCLTAKAALSRQLRASPVSLNGHGRIMLRHAKHPLLMLTKDHVVANDILVDESVAVLVITGPNTGGKTVTLKILGLFALMVRTGLHLPCAPDSEMALFPSVYADIGDAQDLTKDLSSFSAHITKVVQLLGEVAGQGVSLAGEGSREVLVLLDEPVTSTDPTEGAALASALLTQLARRGLKVVVTTHYTELKALAQSTPGFANASVQFDLNTLSPTYRVVMGLPGGSAALDIAGRLGMEEAILDDARNRLQRNDRLLERLLSDVHERQRELTADLDHARQARQDAEQAAEAASSLLAELRESEREERKGLKRKLTQEFQRARAQVQAMIDELKRDQKLEKAKETKQRLAQLEIQSSREGDPGRAAIDPSRLDVGSRVELTGLGLTGILLESPQGKKRVRVKVGEGAVLATVSDLAGIDESRPTSPKREGERPAAPRFARDSAADGDAAAAVDVRGQAGDEALESVVSALDRATLAGRPLLRIIHGYGTGRLKAVLRNYLTASPYVARFRAGERAEGGDGVTIVELK